MVLHYVAVAMFLTGNISECQTLFLNVDGLLVHYTEIPALQINQTPH